MIQCKTFMEELKGYGIDFFTGVPDSLLSSLSAYLLDYAPENHIIAVNEGNAVGIAAGYHLATGKIPVVYMQNSGIGNTVNPVASLLHRDVYQIPALFIVGWRGEPGVHDEPQHVFQGKVTIELLEDLDIKTEILSTDWMEAAGQMKRAVAYMEQTGHPFAFVVHKGTFEAYPLKEKGNATYPLTREKALELICDAIPEDGVIVSTTGKMSRELFEIRERNGETHEKDFLTVGSMGHASSIALGIARSTKRPVYCLDGDGAVLMHMGAMAIIGQSECQNYKHIVINNGCHESVGGQPTVGFQIKIAEVAKACGYKKVYNCQTEEELKRALAEQRESKDIELIQIYVNPSSRGDLGRPTISAIKNKENFMTYLAKDC
ncbi:MAG: phosphonopyruvate decarboxylase [Lachnospiraceae bacterium]